MTSIPLDRQLTTIRRIFHIIRTSGFVKPPLGLGPYGKYNIHITVDVDIGEYWNCAKSPLQWIVLRSHCVNDAVGLVLLALLNQD